MLTRRNFLKFSAAAAGYVLMPGKGWVAMAQPALLDPLTVPQFVTPLPNALDPSFVFTEAVPNTYEINMRQTTQNVLGAGFGDTTVWGYGNAANADQGPTYPGRTFVVQRDQQIQVQWINSLNRSGHLLPVDVTLHWADPLNQMGKVRPYTGPIPIVPHVHGGHTESPSDGLPEYWWTPSELIKGPRFEKSLYTYDNDQEAGTLWYHDHALGITRLNVYAGLAGFYIIRDANDTGLPTSAATGLPTAPYEVPIVIQDRMFTASGQLFYPTTGPELPGTAPDPSALPEFFGNVIVVNGVAWPVLEVEPRKYRFRLLNGSDSRFYNLWLTSGSADMMQPDGNGPLITQTGTDDALLYQPIPLQQLTFGPGERADVVIDFAGWQGQTLIMRNNARSPFDKGGTVDPRLDGRIMTFRVSLPLDTTIPDKPLPTFLRNAPITPAQVGNPVRTRKLLLFEGTDDFGRLQPMLGVAEPTTAANGTIQEGTLLWDEVENPITENPALNDVEVWEVYNTTGDAHPIHLHLVSFQILNRQKFRGTVLPKDNIAHNGTVSLGGILTNIKLQGQAKPPAVNEIGWKDTAQMFPGEVTRIIAKFDRPGRYVWHCHILSHEDHEMMRPFHVGPVLDPLALCGPDDHDVISGQTTLCWQPVNLAPCYLLQIAENSNLTLNLSELTVVAPQTQYPTALTPGTYFWRVRVGGQCTNIYEGKWSVTRSFTLI